MKPLLSIPRNSLSSKSYHASSKSICGLNRSFGRTWSNSTTQFSTLPGIHSRQFSAIGHGPVPRPKERLGPVRITGGNKRWLASQVEPPIKLDEGNNTTIRIPDLRKSNEKQDDLVLDRHWLRDGCTCEICKDPDSGQKNFNTLDIPSDLELKASMAEDGGLDIVWQNDFLSKGEHKSHYAPSQIMPWYRIQKPISCVLWDKEIMERDALTIDYDEWMAGKDEFFSGLLQLRTHGLLFLRNVPPSEESVVSIANQIGLIQHTFYGKTWDVRSKPNAENVAYTSSFLGLHQDLLYMAESPRIQILHCLENSCEGGESLFSDGLRVGSLLHNPTNPAPVKQDCHYLSQRRISYDYNKGGNVYHYSQTVLNFQRKSIKWSPKFQSSYQQPAPLNEQGVKLYRKWLAAVGRVRELVEDEKYIYQYKMQPGECVLFDNDRILHGRRQFDTAAGNRWLKGTYVAHQTFESKLKTSREQIMAIPRLHKIPPFAAQNKELIRKHNIFSLWGPTSQEGNSEKEVTPEDEQPEHLSEENAAKEG
ncbi:hypothetical protein F4804DRAFT_170455 [Jackrogersella minutella]|nr:hypothetical protein F4804DRAFT_170455 [Jackrogersella minutella]